VHRGPVASCTLSPAREGRVDLLSLRLHLHRVPKDVFVVTGGTGSSWTGRICERTKEGLLASAHAQRGTRTALPLCDAFLAGARSDSGSAGVVKSAPAHSLPSCVAEIARSLIRERLIPAARRFIARRPVHSAASLHGRRLILRPEAKQRVEKLGTYTTYFKNVHQSGAKQNRPGFTVRVWACQAIYQCRESASFRSARSKSACRSPKFCKDSPTEGSSGTRTNHEKYK